MTPPADQRRSELVEILKPLLKPLVQHQNFFTWEEKADAHAERILQALTAAGVDLEGNWQDKAEGLECDLDSAISMLIKSTKRLQPDSSVAWWLAANYRTKVVHDPVIRGLAKAHEAPVGTWNDWWLRAALPPKDKSNG